MLQVATTCATASGVTPYALTCMRFAPLHSKACTDADLRCLIAADSAVVPAQQQVSLHSAASKQYSDGRM